MANKATSSYVSPIIKQTLHTTYLTVTQHVLTGQTPGSNWPQRWREPAFQGFDELGEGEGGAASANQGRDRWGGDGNLRLCHESMVQQPSCNRVFDRLKIKKLKGVI